MTRSASTRRSTSTSSSLDLDVAFAGGETIHTESAHKYTAAQIERIARATGFNVAKTWIDERQWFTDALLVVQKTAE